jgi:thioredoxin 1
MNNLLQGTLENFKELVATQDKVILIDFYAEWCGPCRNLSPILDQVAEKYGDILVIKVNVDTSGELGRGEPYNVRSIPQMFIMKNGEVKEKITGAQSMDKLSSMIDPFLN